MAWLRVQLTDEEQEIVNEERVSHPNERIRERMLVLWLLHKGMTRQKAAVVSTDCGDGIPTDPRARWQRFAS